MDVDLAYERDLKATKTARQQELAQLGDELARAQDWMGLDGPRARFGLRLEKDRLKEQDRGKRGPNRKELRLSKQQLRAVAREAEVLIPVRLEWEHEAYKLRDTFTWNLKGESYVGPFLYNMQLTRFSAADTVVTPELFASHLCDDLRLPLNPFYKEIVAQIKRHIEDAQAVAGYDGYLGNDLADVRSENRAWFERRARRLREEEGEVNEPAGEDERDMAVNEFAPVTGISDELRVTIKVSSSVSFRPEAHR